jgi:hypothetical protein
MGAGALIDLTERPCGRLATNKNWPRTIVSNIMLSLFQEKESSQPASGASMSK